MSNYKATKTPGGHYKVNSPGGHQSKVTTKGSAERQAKALNQGPRKK